MPDDRKFDEACDFIAAHFKEGAFRATELFRTDLAFHNRRRTMVRWAAASIVAVTLSAAAIITYNIRSVESEKTGTEQSIVGNEDGKSRAMDIIHLEFNDERLSEVIKAVEEAYGVRLTNVPDDEIYLTLSYEGNAQDFIETVNELLDTDIQIVE